MSDLAIQLPAHQDQTSFNLECWSEILADPFYAKLEQRIETDRHGHIIMTPPPSFSHSFKGSELIRLLNLHFENGQALHEVPISTSDGVRAADVAWLSFEQLEQAKENNILLNAPEICVEVLSPRNSETEMQEKAALYFDAGATEVWLCDDDGSLRFFTAPGQQVAQSPLAPDFPNSI
jgi:Uma2 family endonuclease